MYNAKIEELFEEIADMMELDDENRRFEILAYRKAALTIGTLQEDVAEIYKKQGIKGLMDLPGIGRTMADRIREYIETGKMQKYERLKKKYPIDFAGLTKIQGLGAKRALKLYETLKIRNMDDLKKAIERHKIRDLEGFGEKSEDDLAKGIGMLESSKGRMLLGTALPEAEAIRDKLLASGIVEKAVICGSTRRMKETVGDLDILLISGKGEKVMDFVVSMQEVERVMLRGPTKTTVWLKIGLGCDFRLVEKGSFGAAVQYFTGNKNHNVKVREIAIRHGYKLNEYGMFNRKNRNVVPEEDEEEVYRKLGIDYMEPEMREDRGEINLALQHKLPKIIELEDIRGDLHVHSTHSEGTGSIEEMAREAERLGRRYIGSADHSKSERIANGMDDKGFLKVFDEVDKLNTKLEHMRVLKSGEVDILKDGTFDLQDKTLEKMDYVLAAIHSGMNMGKDEMTKRVVKAIRSGQMHVLAHPTCRLINERESININLDKVFEAAAENNVAMEINALPMRLDLNDESIFRARSYKLKFAINTDAHRPQHLQFMRYGVGMAKRGWLTKEDVINTYDVEKLLKTFG